MPTTPHLSLTHEKHKPASVSELLEDGDRKEIGLEKGRLMVFAELSVQSGSLSSPLTIFVLMSYGFMSVAFSCILVLLLAQQVPE